MKKLIFQVGWAFMLEIKSFSYSQTAITSSYSQTAITSNGLTN